MRRSIVIPSALVLMVGFALAGIFAPRLSAQDATPTPAVTQIDLTPGFVAEVFSGAPSALAPGQTVYTVRFTIQPGSEIFPHGHPGTTVLSVDSGSFGWTLLQGTAHVVRGAGTGGTAVEDIAEPNTEVILEPGDTIYYEDDVIHTARNAGDETTIVMGTLILKAGEPLLMPAGMDMSATPTSDSASISTHSLHR
jgi:quercetin dioxygenase-like cupin family protein